MCEFVSVKLFAQAIVTQDVPQPIPKRLINRIGLQYLADGPQTLTLRKGQLDAPLLSTCSANPIFAWYSSTNHRSSRANCPVCSVSALQHGRLQNRGSICLMAVAKVKFVSSRGRRGPPKTR